ncbi:DUF305 domain-containing protein [Streptomyces sp. HB2AG]|nr:DUF305 domain-containing protein [Streptomyces sp. HB2AG]MCZ2527593.1 DUF305 domain-containing protein [Streptomyces sp. HB2AG]
MSRPLLAVGAVAGVLAAALAGALLTLALTGSDGPSVPGEDSADVGFARDMAIHHQQAVEMSFIVRDRTDDEDVRRLAYDVINTQANQRGMMLGWLDSWGVTIGSDTPPMQWMEHGRSGGSGGQHGGQHGSAAPDGRDAPAGSGGGALMPGMATEAELEQLREAEGEEAEVLYLRLMTEHHRAGVDMAEAGEEMAGTEEIRDLAAGMVEGQASEINLMARMLAERDAATG